MSKYKKIVVIGCDGVGKTTFINKLAEVIGYSVVKGSSFEMTEGKNNEELFEAFNELTELENVIFDRFTYCNYVYASEFADYASLTVDQIRELEKVLQDDTLLIYLTAKTETIIDRFNTRGEDYVRINQIDSIKEKYDYILFECELRNVSFNTSYIDSDSIVEVVLPFLK